jgi:hypothetical protein
VIGQRRCSKGLTNFKIYCNVLVGNKILVCWHFHKADGVNFLLNAFVFVNTQIRDKFQCVISALSKVI